MAKKNLLVSEEQVKNALKIDSFRNLSKDKIMEFVSLIPQMDREVAISIINQFPEYVDLATQMVDQLNVLCDRAMASNDNSQVASIESYKQILNELGKMLEDGKLTFEEKQQITDKMILVADKIAAKDTENKKWLDGVMKFKGAVVVFALALGAAILGVNIKGHQIPQLDDDDKGNDDKSQKSNKNFQEQQFI